MLHPAQEDFLDTRYCENLFDFFFRACYCECGWGHRTLPTKNLMAQNATDRQEDKYGTHKKNAYRNGYPGRED